MTSKRAKIIIAFVWILSFIVSFPPLLGWNDTGSIIAQGESRFKNRENSFFEQNLQNFMSNRIFFHLLYFLKIVKLPF